VNEQYRKHLSDLLTHTRANVAILIAYSDETVIAPGKLSSSALRKLVVALHRHWSAAGKKVLNRFVGFDLDDQFLLLFAKYLPHEETLLGLAFPLETPLRTIRQEMTEVMRSLAVLPEQDSVEQSLQYTGKHETENDPTTIAQPEDHGWHREINGESVIPVEPSSRKFVNLTSTSHEDHSDTHTKGITSHHEASHQPESSQDGKPMNSEAEQLFTEIDWQPQETLRPYQVPSNQPAEEGPAKADFPEHQPVTEEIESKNSWQALIDLTHQSEDLISILQDDFALKNSLEVAEEWMGSKTNPPISIHRPEIESAPLSEFQREKPAWENNITDMTFYLVPRIAYDLTLGKLPQKLREWLAELSQIYGWQLDDISVMPKYLKWTLRDFPELLITRMLKIIRTKTSERIYQLFPDLLLDSAQSDFWAPGYMVDPQNGDFSNWPLTAQNSKNHV
jgi:hypothetical protein